jgi:hypothetical protein
VKRKSGHVYGGRGLIIRAEPLELILNGTKTWEIRGRRTSIRGSIALIRQGSGLIVGAADLLDVVGPMSPAALVREANKTGNAHLDVSYLRSFAWVLGNVRRLATPVPYSHPNGAVVWIRLPQEVARITTAPGADSPVLEARGS